jgi:23S rRNA pseudouridine2605 synthase
MKKKIEQEMPVEIVERGDKLQKVLAQAGFGSRRTMEEWIAGGGVSVNGEPATLGMRVVEGDLIRTDRRTIRVGERERDVRILLYHKQEGEIVSRDDPEKRTTVFDKLPKLRGQKWTAIGRLDFNTSGLLIFTTSGELANRLMHPRFEVEREYAVRVQGKMSEAQMEQMLGIGIELEDGRVIFDKLLDEGGEGFNHWYRVMLKEGRNRIVRRTFEALGLTVSRLIRVRFGLINLPPRLKRGMTAELGTGEVEQVLEWVGLTGEQSQSENELVESVPILTGRESPRLPITPVRAVTGSRSTDKARTPLKPSSSATAVSSRFSKSKTGIKR